MTYTRKLWAVFSIWRLKCTDAFKEHVMVCFALSNNLVAPFISRKDYAGVRGWTFITKGCCNALPQVTTLSNWSLQLSRQPRTLSSSSPTDAVFVHPVFVHHGVSAALHQSCQSKLKQISSLTQQSGVPRTSQSLLSKWRCPAGSHSILSSLHVLIFSSLVYDISPIILGLTIMISYSIYALQRPCLRRQSHSQVLGC